MRRPIIAVVASAALVLSACSSGGDGGTIPSATATESPMAAAVSVTATEYAFSVPAEVPGGVVEMRFSNTGGLPHEFGFIRIKEGKTEADVEAVITSREEPPGWMHDVAGVPGLSPNQSVTVTRTLGAGSYVFICYFPDPEGTPHAALGMSELFTIAGDTGAALPVPDAIITATDDGLQVPTLDSRRASGAVRERRLAASRTVHRRVRARDGRQGRRPVDRGRVRGRTTRDLPWRHANDPGRRVGLPHDRPRARRGVHGARLLDEVDGDVHGHLAESRGSLEPTTTRTRRGTCSVPSCA